MKNTTRALRRHHNARMLNRAIRKIKHWESNPNHLMWRARRTFNNMKTCSCDMCCNERNNPWLRGTERLTFAERKNLDSFNDQMQDLDFYEDLGDNIVWLENEQ